MGRGASRSKSGGMTVMKDAERKITIKNDNISLFNFLQEGCFEKDFMAYCANRLNDYSCVHWLEPYSFDGEHSLPGVVNETSVPDNTSQKNCYHEGEFQTMYIMKITKVVIPLIVVVALASCLLTFTSVLRVAQRLFPLGYYLVYIAIFDTLDLILRGGDVLIEAFSQIKVLSALQILTRSSCQMLPFFYSFFKHAHMSLYLAMAIDNWRFVKRPRHMNLVLKNEWIRNVFIVIVAVLLTVNAQFFWTFDVTENDNKILHNRYVKSTFECSFSTTWPLAQVFTEYIWPIMDHVAGELLPMCLCLWFGASYFWSTTAADPKLAAHVINLDLLLQMNYSISVISLLFGLFSIPKIVYLAVKYSYFLSLKSTHKVMKETIRSKSEYTVDLSQNYNKEEVYFQYAEFAIKYANFLFIIMKFLILMNTVDLVKSRVWHLLSFCRSAKRKNSMSDCQRCSQRSCERCIPAIIYSHQSASLNNPRESVTLCSYTM